MTFFHRQEKGTEYGSRQCFLLFQFLLFLFSFLLLLVCLFRNILLLLSSCSAHPLLLQPIHRLFILFVYLLIVQLLLRLLPVFLVLLLLLLPMFILLPMSLMLLFRILPMLLIFLFLILLMFLMILFLLFLPLLLLLLFLLLFPFLTLLILWFLLCLLTIHLCILLLLFQLFFLFILLFSPIFSSISLTSLSWSSFSFSFGHNMSSDFISILSTKHRVYAVGARCARLPLATRLCPHPQIKLRPSCLLRWTLILQNVSCCCCRHLTVFSRCLQIAYMYINNAFKYFG